jgi:hypothetical protein
VGEWEKKAPTSALDGGEWSASCPLTHIRKILRNKSTEYNNI